MIQEDICKFCGTRVAVREAKNKRLYYVCGLCGAQIKFPLGQTAEKLAKVPMEESMLKEVNHEHQETGHPLPHVSGRLRD